MNWLFSTMRTARLIQQLLNMVGIKTRRNNRNWLFSIVGLGLGAAALNMIRGRNMNQMMAPVKNVVEGIDLRDPMK